MPAAGTAPEPGAWTIDQVHSFVSFSVEHMGIAVARGLTAGPSGTITIAPGLTSSAVTAAIDASTLTTGNGFRDGKILGPDVLDAKQFPVIEFASDALRETGQDSYDLDGRLTLRGVTRPLTLSLRFNGVITDSWGKTRLGVTASGTLRRDEFGAGDWGHVPLPLGGIMVPHAVSVVLDIEAVKDEPES
ncbi:MAG TPA: YceI family protein [Trebonia sp.]